MICVTSEELESVVMSVQGIQKKIEDLRYRSEEGFDNRELGYLSFELADVEADSEELLIELDAMFQYGGWGFEADDIFDQEEQKQKDKQFKTRIKEFSDWQGYYPHYGVNQEVVASGHIAPAFIHKTVQSTYVKPSKAEKTVGGFLIVKEG